MHVITCCPIGLDLESQLNWTLSCIVLRYNIFKKHFLMFMTYNLLVHSQRWFMSSYNLHNRRQCTPFTLPSPTYNTSLWVNMEVGYVDQVRQKHALFRKPAVLVCLGGRSRMTLLLLETATYWPIPPLSGTVVSIADLHIIHTTYISLQIQ